MAGKADTPITLVVRRGALRRFHKLQQDTRHLPVVVTWDRRQAGDAEPGDGPQSGADRDRRSQLSFTWDLADFIVVPGDAADADPDLGGDKE